MHSTTPSPSPDTPRRVGAAPRVALVHDWLNGMRGGEKILEVLCELFPDAVIHTLMCERERLSPAIARMEIRTSCLQRLPLRRAHYRWYLPLFPALVERFDLHDFDLVVSTSHCVAKGARAPRTALHVCYCLTPMRYIWYFGDEYFGRWGWRRRLAEPFFASLRRWDVRSAKRVDRWIAISRHVADRIERVYGARSEIIYPPVDAAFFTPGGAPGAYHLAVSALVPYKRLDIAVRAFNALRLPLVIVGEGPERRGLESLAGPTVTFRGWLPDAEVRELYRGCRAFVFPGEEDFGITPLEAQACGRPVIAYARGGALETVRDGETGILFREQSPEALAGAVREASRRAFDPAAARANALSFDRARFRETLRERLGKALADFRRAGGIIRRRPRQGARGRGSIRTNSPLISTDHY
ncbi:MAG: glycosyltransferase [bacterium]|nr:glycosyltransferase [bacterium]